METARQERGTREALRALLERRLGLAGGLRLARPETGKFNETFFVDGEKLERPLVVRMAPPDDRSRMLFYEHRMMRQEPGLHRILRERTSAPVPEVLHFEENSPDQGRDVIVMERLPGGPLWSGSGPALEELGAALREVHETVRASPGRYGYLGDHRPMEPRATWREAFAAMWNALLDDIERCNGAEAGDLAAWRELLERHGEAFCRFEEPASLLHMDVWAENILVDGRGRLTGLIDWDRALWGDPEIEFAVLEYCGVDTPAFWRGYGKRRPAGPDAEIRRAFYLLYEILKYIVIRIARQGDRTGAARYRQMAAPLLDGLQSATDDGR